MCCAGTDWCAGTGRQLGPWHTGYKSFLHAFLLSAEGRQALILDGVLRPGARIGPDPRLILDQAYLIKRSHDTPKKGIKLIYYDF